MNNKKTTVRNRLTCACTFWMLLLLPVCAQEKKPASDRYFDIVKNLDVFNSIYKELEMFYVDTLDAAKVIRKGIDAVLTSLDPYNEYYPDEETTELKTLTTGKYGGIGSIIRMRKDKGVMIEEPYERMPAAKVGLQVGDVLKKIDGVDLTGKATDEVSSMLRGEPGTTFALEILRPGETKNRIFKITRESIKLPAITYYGVHSGHGYIYLNSFTENCSQEVRKAIIQLKEQGAGSIVLDLRGNGGGLLQEAVNIVNLFVPKGKEIVSTKGKVPAANNIYRTQNEPLDEHIPVVVLVDHNTASAAEIVAGALQDLDRGVVVGSRTFGKGLVQMPRELPYNGMVKLTTSKYYIPSGRCIQAIDYKNKREGTNDGRVPDSLTHVFHTAGGREVRDGGGIKPDVEVQHDTVVNLVYYLSAEDVVSDWCTRYCQTHTRPATVDDFHLTAADVDDFKQAVVASGFQYDRLSERTLTSLRKLAEFEGYYDDAKAEFDALELKLKHNLDKEFAHFHKEIIEMLEMDIIVRWFYQRGVVLHQLKDDDDFTKACELLDDVQRYAGILQKQ